MAEPYWFMRLRIPFRHMRGDEESAKPGAQANTPSRNMWGEVLARDDFPLKTVVTSAPRSSLDDPHLEDYARPTAGPDDLPHMFDIANRFILVSESFRDALRTVDMGRSQFFDTEFVSENGEALPFRHRYWNIGNARECVVQSESPNVKVPFSRYPELFSLNGVPKDGGVVIRGAEVAEADFWVDPRLQSCLFLTDRTKKALETVGFSAGLEIARCATA